MKDEASEFTLSFKEDSGAFWVSLGSAVSSGLKPPERKPVEGLNKGLNKGLNEGLTSLLEAIQANPGCKAKELGPMLDRPIKTLERQISSLLDKRLIERRGSRKTGGYFAL